MKKDINLKINEVNIDVLHIKHIELKQANKFVIEYHRHHQAVTGHKFSIGCYNDDKLVGVAIVGRPIARRIDQYNTVEVLRLCTDGTKNACSMLYGACKRAAKELGYERIITYILETESGISLIASGWNYVYTNRGGSWNVPSRKRIDCAPTIPKKLYESILNRRTS